MKELSNYVLKNVSKQECEDFQKQLKVKQVEELWKIFRESGNSHEGKISKQIMKKVFAQVFGSSHNDHLTDAIFERFKMDAKNDQREDDKIELQDLIISLCCIARWSNEVKIFNIFVMSDVDEDGCLDVSEILCLIKRIERNFCIENSKINFQSVSLYNEHANKKATRKFNWIISSTIKHSLKDKNIDITPGGNNDDDNDDGLITAEEFMESLRNKPLIKERFIPNNLPLYHILNNINQEFELQISNHNKEDFEDFRKQMHGKIRNNYTDQVNKQYAQEHKGNVKLPGKVEIIRYDEYGFVIEENDKKKKTYLMNSQKINQNNQASQKQSSLFIISDKYLTNNTNHLDANINSLAKHEERVKKMKELSQDPKFQINLSKGKDLKVKK